MPLSLSQEVIDEIIDYLASERSDLARCSLVCKAFHSRCTIHLHSTISIGPLPAKGEREVHRVKAIELVTNIIKRNPHLPGYIRHLRLFFVWGIHQWPYKDTGFLDLLRMLKTRNGSSDTFKEVTIADPGEEIVEDEPAGYLESFREIFWRPLAASSITKLSFHQAVEIPVIIILDCINLVDIESYFSALLPLTDEELAVALKHSRKPIELKRLSLGTHFANNFYNLLLGAEEEHSELVDITKLEIYGSSWHPYTDTEWDDKAAIQRTLRIACKTLRKLEFQRIGRISNPTEVIDLRNLQNIQFLDFDFDWRYFPEETFENMCNILATARQDHKVQRIDVHEIIHSDALLKNKCSVRESSKGAWASMDTAFLQLVALKSSSTEYLTISYEMIICTKAIESEIKIRDCVESLEKVFLKDCFSSSRKLSSVRILITSRIEQYNAFNPRHRDVMHTA